MSIFFNGTFAEVEQQIASLVSYYGANAKVCDVIANEQRIGG